ncbi:hypothetical protein H310_12533 [Aphanomyces invadans]|uniref:CDT1 Geminin-binding domain-containing protein n=1 Tax=Aphanomyces invadans TaxID=157072 RepID=A0A024THN4_9STRA|nr:hypothetical protein H310_12533 [Aphanomyces invadans]ETV93489.1 hypothetical protein H310_12533 [Aphanomyces invadans]|eukprot:XP_008877831.1 hypothetical protein H310_12533 [Aphanomyces invadans]
MMLSKRSAAKAAAAKRALEEAAAEETVQHEQKKAKVVCAASFTAHGMSEHMTPSGVHVAHLFSSLEFSLTTMALYHRTASFSLIKAAVESSCKCSFTESDLARIVAVFPAAYDLSFTKPANNVTRPEWVIQPTSTSYNARMNEFCANLNKLLADHLARTPNASKEVSLDLDIPEAALPSLEEAVGPTPMAQLREQEHRHAATLTPLEQATYLAKPVPKELQGLPAWLVDKVRTAEWRKKALTTKVASGDRLLATLPTLCDQIQAFASFTGKSAFDQETLVKELNKAPMPEKIKDQIALVAEKVPFWLTVVPHGKAYVVRLNSKQNYRVVRQVLTNLTV